MKRKITDSLCDILRGISHITLVEFPCKIINVHSPYLVDVEYYSNNSKDILLNVPVKHQQTQKAYVYLGINVGDKGTLRFFDNDVSKYREGVDLVSSEIRTHNINDSVFSFGFYPDNEQYVFPDGDVVIGTNNGATVTLSNNCIYINGGNISINGSNLTLGSNTVIDGKTFLEHKHTNGNQGNPTGGVI